MSNNPIAMYPILLSRSDNSSEQERERCPGCTIDNTGKPLEHPELTPEQNALEGNPNLMFEHWDEFWRKVHGPRVAYKESAEEYLAKTACTYYQVHRLPAAPSSAFPPPYKPLTDENGVLYSHIWDKVPAYVRPSFDGLVYWAAPTVAKLIPIGYSATATEKINHEGNLFNRNWGGSMSAEYVIIPSDMENYPPICTVKLHRRKSGSQEELQQHLLHEHSERIVQGELAKKYFRRFAYIFNINKKEDEPFYNELGISFDAISVTYFRNMAECEAYYGSEEYRAIQEIENTLLDTNRSEWWTGMVYPVVLPESESVTDRNASVLWE